MNKIDKKLLNEILVDYEVSNFEDKHYLLLYLAVGVMGNFLDANRNVFDEVILQRVDGVFGYRLIQYDNKMDVCVGDNSIYKKNDEIWVSQNGAINSFSSSDCYIVTKKITDDYIVLEKMLSLLNDNKQALYAVINSEGPKVISKLDYFTTSSYVMPRMYADGVFRERQKEVFSNFVDNIDSFLEKRELSKDYNEVSTKKNNMGFKV